MVEDALREARALVVEGRAKHERATELKERINKLQEEYAVESASLDKYLRSATIIGTISDNSIKNTTSKIEEVINKALAVIFPHDPRVIEIDKAMHNKAYPHFNVKLYTGVERSVTSFKFSGSGLQQIVSFLFTISFIDAHKGRPFIVMDELLNGLHPSAKALIRDMVKAVSSRFQFVIVEYGMDIGKEYLVERHGNLATVELYNGLYYRDMKLNEIEQLDIGNK